METHIFQSSGTADVWELLLKKANGHTVQMTEEGEN
jgi:hypothetical protein